MTNTKNTLEFKSLSVVIPLYNEEESLSELYQKIIEVTSSLNIEYEIVFVDDGSKDNSLNILKQLHKEDKEHIKIISFRRNYGKAAALSIGFKYASGEAIITMDADLQDDPNEIPNLLSKLNEGYDLVSGWKKKRYDPITKTVPSKLFNKTTSLMTGINIHDFNCGLKAYRKEVTEDIKVYGELHRYMPVLAHWQGYNIGEIPVEHHKRKFGKTKYGLWRFFSGFFDLLTVLFLGKYIKRPLHFFGIIGSILCAIGIGIGMYLLVLLIMTGKLNVRPIMIVSMLSLITGIQFFSMGLIGEMIAGNMAKEEEYSVELFLDNKE